MDEHRADRQQIEARIAELEKQLADYAKKNPADEFDREMTRTTRTDCNAKARRRKAVNR